MHRVANRSSVLGIRGPGAVKSTQIQQALSVVSANDTCLLIMVNRTREGLTVRAESRTPQGPSFLDSLTADLDVGGIATLFCCTGNDLHVDCSNGKHKLSIQHGELRLLPGQGFRQKMTLAGLHLPAKFLLHVEVDEVVKSHDHVYPSAKELLCYNEDCTSVTTLSSIVENLHNPWTMLVPRRLPRILASLCPEDLLKHLTMPVALFFGEFRGGVEVTLDGSKVDIRILPNGKIAFEIGASVAAPAVRLISTMEPLRSSERFQIMYLCD